MLVQNKTIIQGGHLKIHAYMNSTKQNIAQSTRLQHGWLFGSNLKSAIYITLPHVVKYLEKYTPKAPQHST